MSKNMLGLVVKTTCQEEHFGKKIETIFKLRDFLDFERNLYDKVVKTAFYASDK